MQPVMLIDLDRLDHNIDVVMQSVQRGGKHLRLVEKNPCHRPGSWPTSPSAPVPGA